MAKTPLDALPEIDRFYHIFGKAFAQWGELEYYLSLLFKTASDLDYPAAQAIFFSGRNFRSRADILSAALTHSTLAPEWCDFIAEALGKALSYEGFRNRLAHCLLHPNALDDDGAPIEWRLKEGEKWDQKEGTDASQIQIAAANFEALRMVIVYALHNLGRKEPPTKYREQLLRLPSEADASQLSRKQLGRLHQRKASRK